MVNFKWDITAGQVVQAFVWAALGLTYITTMHASVDQLSSKVSDMKVTLDKVSTKIESFPDLQAQATQQERRITTLERRADVADDKLSDITARVTGVETILRQTPYRSPAR